MKIKGKVLNVSHKSFGKYDSVLVTFQNPKGNESEYEVTIDKETGHGDIIRNGIDYAGLEFENKKLVDYDMVFELSKYAIIAIRKCGYTVSRDYEPITH